MRSQFQNQIQWEQHYTRERSRQQYPDENVVRYFSRLLRQLPAESQLTVLDLGTGSGRHLQYLNTLPLRAFGCDYSWEAIKLLPHTIQAHAAELPFRALSFDVVLCWGVLHYLPAEEIPSLTSEVWRILKPGGRFFLTVRSDLDTHLAQTIEQGDLAGGKVKLYSEQEAKSLLQAFRNIQTGFISRRPLGESGLIAHHILEGIK